jgi:hypothetical protein
MKETSQFTSIPSPGGKKPKPWQRLLPFVITAACFAYLYSRLDRAAAAEGSLYSEEEPDGQENRTDPDEEEWSSAGGQYSRVRDAKTGRPTLAIGTGKRSATHQTAEARSMFKTPITRSIQECPPRISQTKQRTRFPRS